MGRKEKYGIESLPEELRNIKSNDDLLRIRQSGCYSANGRYHREPRLAPDYLGDYQTKLAYIFPDGSMCTTSFAYYWHDSLPWEYVRNLSFESHTYNTRTFSWLNFINSPDEVLKEKNPYAYQWAKDEDIPSLLVLALPGIELLKKAGFAIADTIIGKMSHYFTCNYSFSLSDLKDIYHIFHSGTSLYDVIRFPRNIAKEMKDITNIKMWDSCRKLSKHGLLDVETVRIFKDSNFTEKQIKAIYTIVTKGTDGQKYFSVPSLVRYLRRIDMYEAIDVEEGLQLLTDYIRCCHALDVKPRFDSDSLKREHDVMARNYRIMMRETRNERELERRNLLAQKMAPACQKLHKYDYKEEVFFVRGINDFADLLDEASQQANCVASYADSIAKGTSKIFVMRQVAHPEKSLITIELSPDNKLRQKYLAHNRPIYNKAMNDFISRWLKHVNQVDSINSVPLATAAS